MRTHQNKLTQNQSKSFESVAKPINSKTLFTAFPML